MAKATKRNPNDATLRNVRSANAKLRALDARVSALADVVNQLQAKVIKMETLRARAPEINT